MQYQDFGADLAAEKLLEHDGIVILAETLRQSRIGRVFGSPSGGGRGAGFSCVSAGTGLASRSRSMGARTTGWKGAIRAARRSRTSTMATAD